MNLSSLLSSDPARRGHIDFLESVEGSDSVLLLLEAHQDELWEFPLLDDGVSVGVVGTGAELAEFLQDAEIPANRKNGKHKSFLSSCSPELTLVWESESIKTRHPVRNNIH